MNWWYNWGKTVAMDFLILIAICLFAIVICLLFDVPFLEHMGLNGSDHIGIFFTLFLLAILGWCVLADPEL